MAAGGEKKKSRGKQKIEIKRIIEKKDRTVTFSKRKHGISKKVDEIDILCGSRSGFISVSEAGNVFTTPLLRDLCSSFVTPSLRQQSLSSMGKEELWREIEAYRERLRLAENLFSEMERKEKEALDEETSCTTTHKDPIFIDSEGGAAVEEVSFAAEGDHEAALAAFVEVDDFLDASGMEALDEVFGTNKDSIFIPPPAGEEHEACAFLEVDDYLVDASEMEDPLDSLMVDDDFFKDLVGASVGFTRMPTPQEEEALIQQLRAMI